MTRTYRCLENVGFGGRTYAAGETIKGLTAEQAQWLVDQRAIEPTAPALEPRRIAAIAFGLGRVDPADKSAWTKDGRPEAKAVEKAAGLKDVSADERDEVWALVAKADA